MPLNIQDTTYSGEAASGFLVRAVTGADTIQNGHAYVRDNIKKRLTIPVMKVDETVQDRKATPARVSDNDKKTHVSGNVLEPADYMLYDEFNPRDFEAHWAAVQLNPNLLDRMLPATAEAVILAEVLKRHATYIERAIWQSDTTRDDSLKYFDGWVAKALNSSGVNKVTSNLAQLSATNIADKMEAAHALIPEGLLFDPSMKIYLSYKSAELYRQWQQAQQFKGVDKTSGGVMTFNGKRIAVCAGVPNDTILIAKGTPDMSSNLWIGMNSAGDEDYIKLAALQANSEEYFYKILMKLDVNFGLDEEVVLYHLDN